MGWWSQQDSNLWSRFAFVNFAMVASLRCRLRRSLAQYTSASLFRPLGALGSASRRASLASVNIAMVASPRCRLRSSLAQYTSASLFPALRALGFGAHRCE